MEPSTNVDGDGPERGIGQYLRLASMEPSTNVDGDGLGMPPLGGEAAASMEPSTNVDGDKLSSIFTRSLTTLCFNGAVDERRRRHILFGCLPVRLHGFNGAVDERRRRR